MSSKKSGGFNYRDPGTGRYLTAASSGAEVAQYCGTGAQIATATYEA